MATFDARKARARDEIALGDDEAAARDRSRAGRVDARCEAIVREAFASDDFFTTSSCSGRVSVFATRARDAREGKGEGGTWAYVSHEPARAEEVAAAVARRGGEGAGAEDDEGGGWAKSTLTLRFEPFILAVEARDLEAGEAFVRCARECGYRESGITASERRVICAARCQLRLEAPVVVDGERLVSDEGLETLVRLANEKFQVNADRMERFREAFNAMCAKRSRAKAGPSEEGGALKCVEAKKHVAKRVKDALKRGGWLDGARKSATKKNAEGDVECVILPIKRGAETAFSSTATPDAKLVLAAIEAGDVVVCDDGGHVNGGLGLMSAKKTQNPVTQMKQEVAAMLEAKGLNVNLAQEVPTRWEKLGDLVLLPANAFTASDFSALGAELYACVAKVLGASRVARQAPVSQGPKRESRAVMLYPEGADGWVETKELGVTYGLDVTKVMFSSGNGTEKNRMGAVGANGETVVDLFAGIGYYTLQLLKNAGAAKVYACEWNPNSCEALRHNLRVNGVESRCEVLEGDNRRTAPTGVADRVLLGLLPHAEMSWETAIKALKPKGGVLHVHSNVNSGDEDEWMVRLVSELKSLAETNGRGDLDIVVEHLERVKWYGPRIRHVVCDVRCTSRTHKDDLAPTRNMAPKSAVLARQPARTSGTNVRRVHRPFARGLQEHDRRAARPGCHQWTRYRPSAVDVDAKLSGFPRRRSREACERSRQS